MSTSRERFIAKLAPVEPVKKETARWFEVAIVAKVRAATLEDARTAAVRRLGALRHHYEKDCPKDPANENIALLLANDSETDAQGRRYYILHPATMDLDSYLDAIVASSKFDVGDKVFYEWPISGHSNTKLTYKGVIVTEDSFKGNYCPKLWVKFNGTICQYQTLEEVLAFLKPKNLVLQKEKP